MLADAAAASAAAAAAAAAPFAFATEGGAKRRVRSGERRFRYLNICIAVVTIRIHGLAPCN